MSSTDKRKWSSFGEFFSELRGNAGITLEELSEISKIQIRHLRNLEQERFDLLPPYVYVRGFIARSCAVFTQKIHEDAAAKSGIDSSGANHISSYSDCQDKLTRLYISRAGFYNALTQDKGSKSENAVNNRAYNNSKLVQSKVFVTPMGIAYFLVATLFLSVLFYLSGRFIPFLFTPEIELFYPSTENTIVNFSKFRINGHAKWAASLTVEGEEVYIGENGEFEKTILLKEGVNMTVLEAENIFGRTKEVVRRVVYIKN